MHRKVAFIGSVGSGKTTIVENLSGFAPINTDVEATENIGKKMTTVGIDFGQIMIGEDLSLGLYGVPGQRKFSMVWEFVKTGLWALVILVKNENQESIEELSHLLSFFEVKEGMPCVIAVTHCENASADTTIKQIENIIKRYEVSLPIYTIDPRRKESAMLIMHTLIAIDETT
ncbi:MAG: hypothetical protein R3E90_14200 [Marinicella sp.]|nr:hypothetical protein [Xanthomonadales bacterium]